jgi:hypothetical protein
MTHSIKRAFLKRFLLAACFMGHDVPAAFADEGRLILPEQTSGNIAVVMHDASERLAPRAILQMYVGSPQVCCTGKTPMAGTYSVQTDRVIFDPAFDLVAGQAYTIATQTPSETLTAFSIQPENEMADAAVVAIYPSDPAIPEQTNILVPHAF